MNCVRSLCQSGEANMKNAALSPCFSWLFPGEKQGYAVKVSRGGNRAPVTSPVTPPSRQPTGLGTPWLWSHALLFFASSLLCFAFHWHCHNLPLQCDATGTPTPLALTVRPIGNLCA
jgi:hypothetical protein